MLKTLYEIGVIFFNVNPRRRNKNEKGYECKNVPYSGHRNLEEALSFFLGFSVYPPFFFRFDVLIFVGKMGEKKTIHLLNK